MECGTELFVAIFCLLKSPLLAEQLNERTKSIFVHYMLLPEVQEQLQSCMLTIFSAHGTFPLRLHTLPEQICHLSTHSFGPSAIRFMDKKCPALADLIDLLPFLQPILSMCLKPSSQLLCSLHSFYI